MINARVLLINRSYVPIRVITVQRAFNLFYKGIAKAVNEHFEIIDFESWLKVEVTEKDDYIRTINKRIKIPKVLILLTFDKIPRHHLRFNRYNVYTRDNNTCQYCGKTFPRSHLNIDHVIPKSQGGKTVWENVVCCCLSCNKKKGGKTPEQAGMKLISIPKKPNITQFLAIIEYEKNKIYSEWWPFLGESVLCKKQRGEELSR